MPGSPLRSRFGAPYQGNAAPPQVSLTPTGGRLGKARPWGRSLASRDSLIMPAFVLLDLKLPRIDGLEVLRRIRADERTALLPVVVLTTSKEHQDIFEAYRLGANSYIRKPVDFERFLQAVGQLGLYWLSLNEPSDPTAR